MSTEPSTDGSWSAPAFDGLVGPQALGETIVDYRERRRRNGSTESLADISDGGLLSLIKLVYYASLMPEEGQFPKIRVFVTPRLEQFDRYIVPLHRPLAVNSPGVLKKLAPAATAPGCALRIVENDKQIFAEGMVYHDGPSFQGHSPGRPEMFPRVLSGGLHLIVDGPGVVRASEAGESFSLHSGKVHQLLPYYPIPLVSAWFEEMRDTIKTQLISEIPEAVTFFGGGTGIRALLIDLWDEIVSRLIRGRHGGALLVLPGTPSPQIDPITIKYPTDQVNLLSLVLSFWVRSAESTEAAERNHNYSLYPWANTRHVLQRTIETIANLANIDGAVVFSHHLRLLGFGGEIRTSTTDNTTGTVLVRNLVGDPQEEIPITDFGTRHRSAFRLCQTIPGTLAFIISQDGDLRVFTSDAQGEVSLYQNLVPASVISMR